MIKLLSLFIFVIFSFALSANNIFACSCASFSEKLSPKKQVKTAYKNSSAVFIGEVLEIEKGKENFFVKVKFKVIKSWNKNVIKEIYIRTGFGSGDCGFRFEIGETYLIYAYGSDKELGTNICQRTDNIESLKADIPILDKIKKKKN